MNNFSFFLFLTVSISLPLAFQPQLAGAAEIDHHGFQVEESNDADCLECHEDGQAGEGESSPAGSLSQNHTIHPIHLSYPPVKDSHEKGEGGRFRTGIEAQALGIRFQNGQLTCLSCHNLNIPRKGHLVIENTGSRLCLACHKM